MMACQNEEQNTQQETDWGNENLQIEALLPPEQLQQEEQRYWKDYEYFIQMLPMVAREVWIVADALLDQYEYKGSPIYSEYPDKVTILKIADMVYDKLKYREEQEMIQADDEEMIRNPYFVEVSLRDAITPFRTLIQVYYIGILITEDSAITADRKYFQHNNAKDSYVRKMNILRDVLIFSV